MSESDFFEGYGINVKALSGSRTGETFWFYVGANNRKQAESKARRQLRYKLGGCKTKVV